MPYPEDYASMINIISWKLQDTGNAVWTDEEILLYFTEALREISQFSPQIRMLEFLIESRQGTATETKTGSLVDDVNDQFVAGDVGKIVYNKGDRTWAYIKTRVDSEEVTLSKNIMASGESYRIFNKNCNHQKELYIGEFTDWLWIEKIEFPAMEDLPRLVKWIERGRDVIRLDIDEEPDNTKNSNAKKQVWVFFALRHKMSQLTDLVGRVNVAGSEGDTSLAISAMQGLETIEMGQEFTIANERARGIYICTENVTLSAAGAGTLKFWPPLESSVDINESLTFISSTLTPKLEGIFADLVAGKAAMHKASSYINKINVGGANTWRAMYEWGRVKYDAAKEELESIRGFTAPSICLP